MNKRIKNKLIKKSNLKKHENILKEIKKHFTIKEKDFLDGYYIFSMGKNAVCHFTLEDTPSWKYGIWIRENHFYIFGEHIELIDKFKPTQTYISENNVENFINIVQKIKENPKLYFVDSLTYGDALVDFQENIEGDEKWYSGYQVVRIYNEETQSYDKIIQDKTITQERFVDKHYNDYIRKKEKERQEEERDRAYAFNFFKEILTLSEEIQAVGIIDGNKNGFICCPRYDIKILVDDKCSSDSDSMDDLYEILAQIIQNKNYCEDRVLSDHTFDLYGVYNNESEIKICDYIFKK